MRTTKQVTRQTEQAEPNQQMRRQTKYYAVAVFIDVDRPRASWTSGGVVEGMKRDEKKAGVREGRVPGFNRRLRIDA